MKISPIVQTLLNEITQLYGADIIPVLTSESAMLPTVVRQLVIDKYHSIVIPKYKSKLQEMGGVEEVLKNLEDTIVAHIYSISSIENSGEISRSNPSFRKNHQDSDLGRAHTALRLLNDQDNIGPDSYPSILHKNSTQAFNGINLREFLAYYWLAASDPDMAVIEKFQNSNRKEIVQASVSVFIDVLFDIRRAHNQGIKKDSKLDYLSCVPGTFGRIAARSSVYNSLTALTPPPTQLIPEEIQNFIMDNLRNLPIEVKSKVFNYIYKMSNFDDDIDKSQITQINELTTNLKQQKNAVYQHLKNKIPGLFIKNSAEIMEKIARIFEIEVEKLTLKNSEMISGEYVLNILRTTAAPLDQKYLENLQDKTLDYRITLKTLDYNLEALSLLIQHDMYCVNLLPEKRTSNTYANALKFYQETLEGYQNTLEELQQNFQNTLSDVKAVTSSELEKLDFNVTLPTEFNPNFLPETTKKRLTQVQANLAQTKKMFADNKDSDHSNDANSWAINLMLLCTLKDREGKYVNLYDKSQPILFDSLRKKNNHSFVQTVIDNINGMSSQFNSGDDKLKIMNLIETLKNSEKILDRKTVLTLVELQSEFKIIFKDFESIFGPLTVIDLTRNDNDTEKNYLQWKAALQSIMSDPNIADDKEQAIYTFILLTILNNLKIAQIVKMDAMTIREICNLYMNSKENTTILPFKLDIDTPVNDRLSFLAGHMRCIIITLQNLSDLFLKGAIGILKRADTEYFIREAVRNGVPYPFILRIGLAQPNELVITAMNPQKQVVHISTQQELGKNKTARVIENVSFNFYTVDLDALKMLIKNYPVKTLLNAPDNFINSITKEMQNARMNAYTSVATYQPRLFAYTTANSSVSNSINSLQQNAMFFQPAQGNENTNSNSTFSSPSSKEEMESPSPK